MHIHLRVDNLTKRWPHSRVVTVNIDTKPAGELRLEEHEAAALALMLAIGAGACGGSVSIEGKSLPLPLGVDVDDGNGRTKRITTAT